MCDVFSYAILGRGAWAAKMRSILKAEQRRVTVLAHTRRQATESDEAYRERLTSALSASGAQIAWLCVPPGAHVTHMMEAAIAAGVHVIAEKPWLCPAGETASLLASAEKNGIRLGVHFEYCLLDEMEGWRERYHDARGLGFGGRFAVSRPDRLGIPAIENLGCHLMAMHEYAVPHSEIEELFCAYHSADERRVWIASESVDFLENRQPVVQRFIRKFEAATEGAKFPFGIEFGSRVAESLIRWRGRQTAESLRR